MFTLGTKEQITKALQAAGYQARVGRVQHPRVEWQLDIVTKSAPVTLQALKAPKQLHAFVVVEATPDHQRLYASAPPARRDAFHRELAGRFSAEGFEGAINPFPEKATFHAAIGKRSPTFSEAVALDLVEEVATAGTIVTASFRDWHGAPSR